MSPSRHLAGYRRTERLYELYIPYCLLFSRGFNLVIFARRQKFAEIKPTTIDPRIGKVFLLFAMSQCRLEWQCTLLFTEKDIGSGY